MALVHPTCLPSVSRTLTGGSVELMGQCMEKVQVQKGVGAGAAWAAHPSQAGGCGCEVTDGS